MRFMSLTISLTSDVPSPLTSPSGMYGPPFASEARRAPAELRAGECFPKRDRRYAHIKAVAREHKPQLIEHSSRCGIRRQIDRRTVEAAVCDKRKLYARFG